jgi:glycyl-tRNA synthetase alpha subunit
MIELIAPGAFNLILKKGMEWYTKHGEFKNLVQIVQAKIIRETKFNLEVFNEIEKILNNAEDNAEERVSCLIQMLRSSAFESIDNGIIPLNKFFPQELKKEFYEVENYQNYIKNIKNLSELIERVYFRIDVLKMTREHGETNRNKEYINFLLLKLAKELKKLD